MRLSSEVTGLGLPYEQHETLILSDPLYLTGDKKYPPPRSTIEP